MDKENSVQHPLFKTSIKYTFEEYKGFTKAIYRYVYKVHIMLLVIIAALLILFAITKNFMAILAAVAFPLFFVYFMNREIKKVYESNRVLKDNFSVFDFYDKYFEQTNAVSHSVVKYSDIYKIVETGTNFYIMPAVNNGIIISKQNCRPELILFLQTLDVYSYRYIPVVCQNT